MHPTLPPSHTCLHAPKALAEPSGLATMLARGARVRAKMEEEAAKAGAAAVGMGVGVGVDDGVDAVNAAVYASAAAASTATAASSGAPSPLSHLARALAAIDLSADPTSTELTNANANSNTANAAATTSSFGVGVDGPEGDQGGHADHEFFYAAPLPRTLDRLLEGVFRDMRLAHNIAPDEKLVSTLVQLFSAAAPGGRGRDGEAGYSWEGYGSSLFKAPALSEATAQLVFEELIVAGVEVSAMLPILQQCRYSAREMDGIMRDDGAVQRLRASAASSRLFKKYRWNEIKSGWSGLF